MLRAKLCWLHGGAINSIAAVRAFAIEFVGCHVIIIHQAFPRVRRPQYRTEDLLVRVMEKNHITTRILRSQSLHLWRSQRHVQYNNVRLLVQKDLFSGLHTLLAQETVRDLC